MNIDVVVAGGYAILSQMKNTLEEDQEPQQLWKKSNILSPVSDSRQEQTSPQPGIIIFMLRRKGLNGRLIGA